MPFKKTRKRIIYAFLISSMAVLPANAEDTETYSFKVKRAPIAKALFQFAKQSGVSISRPRLSYRDGKTRYISGNYGLVEGLERMLLGTDFTFEIVGEKSVRIFRKPKERAQSADVSHSVASDFIPLQEILVSSLRRVDTLQGVPYSIAAITGSQTEHLHVHTTDDISYRIASLYISKQGPGKDKITIRGLSDGAFSGRAQSAVSIYQDYTRLTYNAPEPGLRLIDVERVEVLRGPQGTLYGSGALSGLYRVVNRQPNTNEIELEASASYAWTRFGDPVKDVSLVVNLPLVENKLGFRTVGYAKKSGGYIDDGRLEKNNTNSADTIGGRVALKYTVESDWNFTVGGSFQKHDAKDSNYYDGSQRRFLRMNYVAEPYKDKFQQLYMTVNADFGWADITSNASWMKRSINKVWDGSFGVPKLVGLAITPSAFTEVRDIKTFTSETHLAGKSGGRLEWVLGSFFSNRTDVMFSELIVPGAAQYYLLGGREEIYGEDLHDTLQEVAFFGEASYYLTEKVSVTGGFRWFYYNNKAVSRIEDIGINLLQKVNGKQKKSGITPKFVLSYHSDDETVVYAQVSQGYRVGGTNILGPSATVDFVFTDANNTTALKNYKSDRLTNFELGYKQQALGGKLAFNTTAFYANWADIQSLEYTIYGLPNVTNIGDARVFGAELDFIYQPSSRLEFQGNIAFSNSKITKIANNYSLFGAEVGGPLPGAPDFSAGLSGHYEFDLTSDVSAAITTDLNYVGGANLLFDKSTSPRMDAYLLSNARFSLYKDAWQLTFFVNNVFDSNANSFAFGNPFSFGDPSLQAETSDQINQLDFMMFGRKDQCTPLRPRTIGLELSWRF